MVTSLTQYAPQLAPILIVLVVLYLIVGRDIRASLDPNRIRVFIKDETQFVRRHYVKIERRKKVETFSLPGSKGTYKVDKARIYRTGLFRVPTSFYVKGIYDPLAYELEQPGKDEKSADDYHTVSHHEVVKQLLASFRTSILTPEMSVGIIIIVVVAAAGGLYYQLGQKLTEIQTTITTLQQTIDAIGAAVK